MGAQRVVLSDLDRDTAQMGARLLIDALVMGIVGRNATIWADSRRTDDYTADGSFANPYKTMEAAVGALTAANTLIVAMPGVYTITETLSLPNFAVRILGLCGQQSVEINAAEAVTPLFLIQPVAAVTQFYVLDSLYINNSESSQVGIQIDNSLCTMGGASKLYLKVRNAEIGDGGNAIDVDHAYGTAAIRINLQNCYVEGAIDFDVGHSGDRFKVWDSILEGAFAAKGDDVECQFKFHHCTGVPSGAWASNDDTQTNMDFVALGCFTDADAAVATGDIGSGADFDETISP